MTTQQLSKIEKQVFVRAPRARVWRAITDAKQFSEWFRVTTKDEFRRGARVHLTSTYPGHEGTEFYFDIDEIIPDRKFSWRWYPASKGSNPAADDEPTLVVFELEDAPGGTLVRVTESGFDHVALERRAKAFEDNSRGWELQTESLRQYVEKAA
jgi:uncharacterized protein YndB with AHSA1/START domain